MPNMDAVRPPAPRMVSSAPARSGGEPFIRLGGHFYRSGEMADFRSELSGADYVSIDPSIPAPTNRISLVRSEFDLSFLVSEDASATSRLNLSLPVNSVTLAGAKGEVTASEGSELGGMGVELELRTLNVVNVSLGYTDRRSSKLHLYDDHSELSGGLYFTHRESIGGGADLRIELGPEAIIPLRSRGARAVTRYGNQWGGRVQFSGETGAGTSVHFRWAAAGTLRRVSSFALGGVEQGGGGLFAVTPEFEYELLDGFWLGVAGEIPLFRPVGREYTMGSVSAPGLFGSSVGLTLRTGVL